MGEVLAREFRDRVRPARLADRALRSDVRLLDLVRMRAEDLARGEVDQGEVVPRHDRPRVVRVPEGGAEELRGHHAAGALQVERVGERRLIGLVEVLGGTQGEPVRQPEGAVGIEEMEQ